MTEVASGIPGQRQDDPSSAGPGPVDQALEQAGDATTPVDGRSAFDQFGERAGDAFDRAAAASGRVASQVVDRLRNSAELAVDRGTTIIADEVVEKIAGIAARDVPGVHDLGGDVARFFASVRERVGLGDADDDADQGISVRLEGATATIDITLVIEFGFVVHSVTERVRTKVISSVENLLGLSVAEVNIRVDDVHVPDTGPVGDDEARAADYPE